VVKEMTKRSIKKGGGGDWTKAHGFIEILEDGY
jgi:hypothetical protein